MNIGDELIYRLRTYSPSERVRIVGIDTRRKSQRYEVEFLDGDKAGTLENIPGGRLRGPWSEVAGYDALMANWARLEAFEMTRVEEGAAEYVFSLIVPREVASTYSTRVDGATTISDRDALQLLIGLPVADLAEQVDSFELDGSVIVSAEGTLLIAEFACRTNPMPVLDWVLAAEKKCQEKVKQGTELFGRDGMPFTTSSEWEYQQYLEHDRPLHELLRSWCGQRASTMRERLYAAEAEVRRLDELIDRLLDELKRTGHGQSAEIIARTYAEERITAANYRPVVDRPLKPSEIPVRYIRGPRRWGY